MFTGLVQNKGQIFSLTGKKLRITSPLSASLKQGDSVSVNGVCLTATLADRTFFEADLSDETLSKTTLGNLRAQDAVNLELPLTAAQNLGGHIVQGHVDTTGKVTSVEPIGDAYQIRIQYPDKLRAFLVEKGSVAVDGVSLTVNAVEDDTFSVMIIPHTWNSTIIETYKIGTPVNLEVDIFAKYIQRAFETFSKWGASRPPEASVQ